jgi:cell wall-associated NlpC family hydrolase
MENERMYSQVVLYDYAMRMVGLPYRWGGNDLVDGLDCSGLCVELLQSVGILPKDFDSSAAGLWSFPAFSKADTARFGSLAYFGLLTSVTHIGFCLNETLMLEAGGGGSKTTSREAAAEQNAYVKIRPIKSRKDFVGFNRPNYPWKD